MNCDALQLIDAGASLVMTNDDQRTVLHELVYLISVQREESAVYSKVIMVMRR